MSQLQGYSKTVVCPYNKSHLILMERMQTHLVKCGRNYPDIVLKKCPFNVCHLMPEADLEVYCVFKRKTQKLNKQYFQCHVLICEDRMNFDLYKYNITPGLPGRKVEQGPVNTEVTTVTVVNDENWDRVS